MKKLLYVRNIEDVFLQSFVKNLSREQYEIFILDASNGIFLNAITNEVIFYKKNLFSGNKYLNYLFRYFFYMSFVIRFQNSFFDIIHILNIKRDNFYLIPFFKNHSDKLFLTVYGRSSYVYFSKKLLFSPFLKGIDKFLFSNGSTIEEFLNVYKFIPKEKVISLPPPIEIFSQPQRTIPNHQIIDGFVREYGYKKGLINVLCSSSVSANDQHFEVIESIKTFENPKEIQLIFMLTYGGSNDYKQKVLNEIHDKLNDFNTVVFDNFLAQEELYELRKVTDIYINMRKSDQLAGAVLESLFEGSLLISAEWLDYSTLDKLGVEYYKVHSFNELNKMLSESVKRLDHYKINQSLRNRTILFENFSLKSVLSKWDSHYLN